MKLLLIKIGKAFNALKRDGFVNGSRRICAAGMLLFRPVGDGDILFISGGVGDSARYRCEHVAQELSQSGFVCSVTTQDNFRLLSYVNKFSVFVLHRTLVDRRMEKLIAEIKRQKKTIIFETDDLVYDVEYLKHMDYYTEMNALERKLYENGVGGEILRDDYVKVATTTTTFLAQKLEREGKKVFIVPNKLSVEDVKNAEKALQEKDTSEKSDKIRIGYFSGTLSHNKDFATVTDALIAVMEKNEIVELFLIGPLDIDERLARFGERVIRLPYVPRDEHFVNSASCDIIIAPLEIGNPFCESKSELKFFEAGIVKVPVVVTATQTFTEAITDGIDGFTATDSEQWQEKLSQLVQDASLRRKMGEKAYQTAIEKYTTENTQNEDYIQYLKEQIIKNK